MLKVLAELEELIPSLTEEEFEGLRTNIIEAGEVREPLYFFIYEGVEILLDGHNRFRIISETGLPYSKKEVTSVRTIEEAKTWMLRHQFGKRNLTQAQKMELALKFKPLLEKIGRERQKTNVKKDEQGVVPTTPHNTTRQLAELAGVSPENLRKFEKISETDSELKEKVTAGKITVHAAYKEVTQREGKLRRLHLKGRAGELDAQIRQFTSTPNSDYEIFLGQWWQLGRHKLYVGDSSLPSFYESEFCKRKFDFGFADPPYGLRQKEWDSAFTWAHDYLADLAGVVGVTSGKWALSHFLKNTGMPYKWAITYWIKNGMARGPMGLCNGDLVLMFSNDSIHRGSQDFWELTNTDFLEAVVRPKQDAYEVPFEGRKPAKVMARLLDMYVQPNGFVIDTFGGSGTTLFVAEQQHKTCIMAEILPAHAAQIIHRFEALTGERAKLL